MQKLIYPYKSGHLICGYKNDKYFKHWGYTHWGVDLKSIDPEDKRIFSLGAGKVIDTGYDNSGGNIIIVEYRDVETLDNKTINLIARFMHLDDIFVKKGDTVDKNTVIGYEGGTPYKQDGSYRYGVHLHLELDIDTKYPYHSPQVSSKDDKKSREEGNILLHGKATTVSPFLYLYTTPERYQYSYNNDGWCDVVKEGHPKVYNENPTLTEKQKTLINRLEKIKKEINTVIDDITKI